MFAPAPHPNKTIFYVIIAVGLGMALTAWFHQKMQRAIAPDPSRIEQSLYDLELTTMLGKITPDFKEGRRLFELVDAMRLEPTEVASLCRRIECMFADARLPGGMIQAATPGGVLVVPEHPIVIYGVDEKQYDAIQKFYAQTAKDIESAQLLFGFSIPNWRQNLIPGPAALLYHDPQEPGLMHHENFDDPLVDPAVLKAESSLKNLRRSGTRNELARAYFEAGNLIKNLPNKKRCFLHTFTRSILTKNMGLTALAPRN